MKFIKGILHILLILFEIILVALILVVFLIRTSSFQTYLGNLTTNYLSEQMGHEINIDKIDFALVDKLYLKNVYAEDYYGDTLVYANEIEVEIGEMNLDSLIFDIEKVNIKNAKVNLLQKKGESIMNFQHFVEYFATNDTSSSSEPFSVRAKTIELSNTDFSFKNFNHEKTSYGVDYNHLDISNLNLIVNELDFNEDKIIANINHLSFKESSGLVVSDLSSNIYYSNKLIGLKNSEIVLAQSNLNFDSLSLLSPSGSEDYNDFLNKVIFKGNIKNSTIYGDELSLFVPSLKGLTDSVSIHNAILNGPVNGMKIKNLNLSMLDDTKLMANIEIPNIDNIEDAFMDQRISLFKTSVSDIEKMNISAFSKDKHIKLPSNLKSLGDIALKNGHFTGVLKDFVVDGDIYTGLGNIYSENGLNFKEKNGIITYQGTINKDLAQDLIVEDFDLRKLTGNSNLGNVNGYLSILDGSQGFSSNEMNLNFNGRFSSIVLNDYNYQNIIIKEGNYANERFEGIIDIEDDNLAMNYDGYVDFSDELEFNFNLNVDSSFLAKMNLFEGELSSKLKTNIKVNIIGNSLDNTKGDIKINHLSYFNGEETMTFDDVFVSVKRGELEDEVSLNSSILDLDLKGQFDFEHLYSTIVNNVSSILPNLIESEELSDTISENYVALLKIKDINPLLNFVELPLYIQPNSHLELQSNSDQNYINLKFNSDLIKYEERLFKNVVLSQKIENKVGVIEYSIEEVVLNDSIQVKNLILLSSINNNVLKNQLKWDKNERLNPANFEFVTRVEKDFNIFTKFSPSFFYLQESMWEIEPNSEIIWNPSFIDVRKVNITNKEHLVSLNGKVSKNPNDWLNVVVKNFDLSELNGFLGGSMTLDGILNLESGIADVYDNVKFIANSQISDLFVNEESVGDIELKGNWDIVNNAISVLGNLRRKQIKTFDFKGLYYVAKERNSLDLTLDFDHTDIAFLNAFSDPELYTDIRGNIDGKLKVTGEPTNPIIEGDLLVESTTVYVPMFNVDYSISGLLNFYEGEILADYLELTDEIGNKGVGMMQIYHNEYSDWNYDVTLDLQDPTITKTFLAMNTVYNEGDIYYGKAMITGDVNIFGYNGLTEITVNAKTEKGTNLTLPLYGTSDIEEQSFVKFYNPDTLKVEEKEVSIERLGMTLQMNFDITEDADVNIVFDPILNDKIVAKGVGQLEMNMDDYGDIAMFGKYTINEGMYFFNMKNIVKEEFEIVEGSSIIWTQSPYDANIDIVTRFKRQVSMNDIISADVSQSDNKEDVYGYLKLGNTLLSPALSFDIEAPDAKDESKNALNQIRSVEDDLNKQFFSLLLLKQFIPIEGSAGASGTSNVTEDLVNQQINSVLGQIGENYNLNSDIGADHAELGFSTSFLDDKLKITSSVGIVSTDDNSEASNLVGDVNVEYELNDDGTFTVNVFNESNDGATDQGQGAFTQGVGLSYQETFNSAKDFKLLQGFLNIFRKEKNKEKIDQIDGKSVPIEEDFTPAEYIEEE